MQIGIMGGATDAPDGSLDGLIAHVKRLKTLGFASFWLANIFGLDAVNTLGLVGRETAKIQLGTAVVPTYPRHPVALAGDESSLRQQISRLRDVGVTDFAAAITPVEKGSYERTLAFLAGELRSHQ